MTSVTMGITVQRALTRAHSPKTFNSGGGVAQLTESQAWRKIGEAYDRWAYTGEVPYFNSTASYGLCYATRRVTNPGEPGVGTLLDSMREKITYELVGRAMAGEDLVYLGSYTQEMAAHRAALAYLFAEETK